MNKRSSLLSIVLALVVLAMVIAGCAPATTTGTTGSQATAPTSAPAATTEPATAAPEATTAPAATIEPATTAPAATTPPEATTAPAQGAVPSGAITYFTFSASPDHLKDLDAMIQAFQTANPGVTVKVETAPFADYFTKLQTLIAGGQAPDVFELNYENFVPYAEKGVLLDLSPLASADTTFDPKIFYPKAYDLFSPERQAVRRCARASPTWCCSTTRTCSTRPACPCLPPTGHGTMLRPRPRS